MSKEFTFPSWNSVPSDVADHPDDDVDQANHNKVDRGHGQDQGGVLPTLIDHASDFGA
jgi:hypothetical protein